MSFVIDWQFVTDADFKEGSSVCLEMVRLSEFGKKQQEAVEMYFLHQVG